VVRSREKTAESCKRNVEAVRSAIKALEEPDPTKRFAARSNLLTWGTEALPFIEEALDRVDNLADPLHHDLVRIRDWIAYGADPRELQGLIRKLDLRTFKFHGNALAGMAEAVESQAAFQKLKEHGAAIRTFIESYVVASEESYSLRAAASILLRHTGSVTAVPCFLSTLAEEHASLDDGDAEVVRLEEGYRGFFIHSLLDGLTQITREEFPSGLMQDQSGILETGSPRLIYYIHQGETAMSQWRRWWDTFGRRLTQYRDGESLDRDDWRSLVRSLLSQLKSGPRTADTYARFALNWIGPQADDDVVAFVQSDECAAPIAVLLVVMLVQNGRASALPDDPETAKLLALALANLEDPIPLRIFIMKAYGSLPASLLAAIRAVFARHPLSKKHSALFNPHTLGAIDFSLSRPKPAPSAAVAREVATGMTSGEPRTRRFFTSIAKSIPFWEENWSRTADELVERLTAAEDEFSTLQDRASLLGVLTRIGRPPGIREVLSLLGEAEANADERAISQLLRILNSLETAEDEKASVLEVLFSLARRWTRLSEHILRALSRIEPTSFPFNPVIGAEGLGAMITLRGLTSELGVQASSVDPAAIAEAIQSIRDEIRLRFENDPSVRLLAPDALDKCIALASKHNIAHELYESLKLKGLMLASNEVVLYQDQRRGVESIPQRFSSNSEYLRGLDFAEFTSYDVAAVCYEAAAKVAVDSRLSKEHVAQAVLMQADIARRAKRYKQSEATHEVLAALVESMPDSEQAYMHRHFLTMLFLEQRRWADALDVAVAAKEAFQQRGELHKDEIHYFLDALLHEALCWHHLGKVEAAATQLVGLASAYVKWGPQFHCIDALSELVSALAAQGKFDDAEQVVERIHDLAEDKPQLSSQFAVALRREAALRMRQGRYALAERLLRRAETLPRSLSVHQHREFESSAEDRWRLGLAQLRQGKWSAARETLSLLDHWGSSSMCPSAIARAYSVLLRSAISASTGATRVTLAALQENADLLEESVYPELKVALCLERHRWSLRIGRKRDAFQALEQAHAIAQAVRDQPLAEHVLVAWARALVELGSSSKAYEIYRKLISECEFPDRSDFVRVAKLGLQLLETSANRRKTVIDPESTMRALVGIQDAQLRVGMMLRYCDFWVSNGNLELAEQLTDRLEEETRTGSTPDTMLRTLLARGQVVELQSRLTPALSMYRNAVRIGEAIRAGEAERGLDTLTTKDTERAYTCLVGGLARAGETIEALYQAERAKGRLLQQLMHWRASRREEKDRRLARYLELLGRLALLDISTHGKSDDSTNAERSTLLRELQTLRAELPEARLLVAESPAVDAPDDWYAGLVADL